MLTNLVIIILVSLFFVYVSGLKFNQREAFVAAPALPPLSEKYTQRLNEIENTDFVLDRPVTPGKPRINNLDLRFSCPTDNHVEKVVGKISKKTLIFKDIEQNKIPNSEATNTIIDDRQPYMFSRGPHVVDYYEGRFYYDWRYPRKPISVKFAADPKGYCKNNLGVYPCNVINSRKDIR